ncbi:AraC family transcriptional regulator [Nocardioides sp. CGMCC 1.13656]|uniref:AraC-like ligand-binding domain-containing protein n=1 Tax=Nocardioides TaxID=1839 RepID=UPI0015EC5325|nr:AraC family transcriptional regulator [Nocardioides sp. CGMCC 1.13656]MBA2952918.1 AraC family transcriptional regulator [Nocardioides sp. CGMCC 1.13656]
MGVLRIPATGRRSVATDGPASGGHGRVSNLQLERATSATTHDPLDAVLREIAGRTTMSTIGPMNRGTCGVDDQAGLPPYTRRTTGDRDEAERVIADLYLPNRLDLSEDSTPLGMEVTGLRLGALTAGRLTYGRSVLLCTEDAENFHVNVPLRGRAASSNGSGEPVSTSPGEGLVFSPGAPAEISWSEDCEQLCLMVPPARLEAELERMLGRSLRGRLVFDFAADLPSPVGQRLRTVLNLLVEELEQPTDVSRNPLVARHVEGLVLDSLLLSQPHNHSDAATRPGPPAHRSAIRRAVALMEENPAEPWTTVRLAAEVHLSPRALQAGFSRDLATPPMAYLREVRLRRAHEALSAADRDATTVRAVATGLGMWHPSRFAAAYRAAFGETPSDTLNRPR